MAAMVPVNLIQEIQHVGFDYNMSPRAVADAIKAGHNTLWDKTVENILGTDQVEFDLATGYDTAN